MKALILAGGKGTRVKGQIKPLLTVAGMPIIEHQIKQLKGFDVYINFHKKDTNILKGYSKLLVENKHLGNATAIKLFANKIKEDFIVEFCDSFNNLNFEKLIEEHKKSNLSMTLVVKNITKFKSFGITLFNKDKVVTGFTRQRFTNTGIFVCKSEIKNFILTNTFQDIDRDLIPKLIKKRQLNVYIHKGFWYDIGTKDYLKRRKNNGKLYHQNNNK